MVRRRERDDEGRQLRSRCGIREGVGEGKGPVGGCVVVAVVGVDGAGVVVVVTVVVGDC